jgi:class 3 adenylate cyclase
MRFSFLILTLLSALAAAAATRADAFGNLPSQMSADLAAVKVTPPTVTPPVVVSDSADFHASVFPHVDKLDESAAGIVPVDQIAAPKLANYFVHSNVTQSVNTDHHVWYRFKVLNPGRAELPLVFYSYFSFRSILVVVADDAGHELSRSEVGYGTIVDQGRGWIFPAINLSFPVGASSVYFGVDSFKDPSKIDFQLTQPDTFDRMNREYIAIAASFLVSALALIVFNAIMILSLRSLVYFYFITTVLGLLLLQACTSGALGFFNLELLASSARIWIHSLNIVIISTGMFAFNYFEARRVDHPWLYGIHYLAAGITLATAVGYPWLWEYSLALVALSVVLLLGVIFGVLLHASRTMTKKVWLFGVCASPLILFGFSELARFYLESENGSSNLYFWGCSLGSLFLFSILNALEIGRNDKRSRALAASLSAVFPPFQVQKIVSEGLQLNKTPSVSYVSIMFVDIVGYTLAARGRKPDESFQFLKDTLGFIGKIVHQYGGIIDKSLGDGCLCFFGYDISGKEVVGHETTAVACALEIQRKMVDYINSISAETKDIFPLRIGVNSASVCIGNMGDEHRVDFTLHGDGVSMAKRFESACEPFKVTIGQSTYQALDEGMRSSEKFYQRLIPIKNANNLTESYECNPFEKAAESIDKARAKYWQRIGVQRLEQRFSSNKNLFVIQSAHGEMQLQNFSLNGFCVRSPVFLGKGAEFTLDLSGVIPEHQMKFLGIVSVQVRWGVPEGDDEFILGTMINGLSDQHRELIFNSLLVVAQRQLSIAG